MLQHYRWSAAGIKSKSQAGTSSAHRTTAKRIRRDHLDQLTLLSRKALPNSGAAVGIFTTLVVEKDWAAATDPAGPRPAALHEPDRPDTSRVPPSVPNLRAEPGVAPEPGARHKQK